MKRVMLLIFLASFTLGGCSDKTSGQEACAAAGGQCRVGGVFNCPLVGTQDCGNPGVIDPGGHYCCLPCPSGSHANPDGGLGCVDGGR